ncbi:MAG TPA: bifunctional 2-polyprenyl-6-hydroxyphenol methylase/3-demethylubiquinol 3-O-methyltransferase UbiG [Nostocaceae cyanobacterium]|nr:bifunctional 2-polyprenyl-6-hydroxyphenol methylase/3-demethylubiquinol 3-O-methyltransferase UbiG [Nostocaceae cyanobacterium]
MKKNNLEYYNLNAEKWWTEGETLNLSQALNKYRFDFFSQNIPTWQNLQVLDVGCGGGLACEFLARQGANVSGIDLSLNSIQIAKEHANKNQLNINYQQGMAEELPFDDWQFDVVICFDVLEHVDDWKKAITEIYRVLKPDGLFLFDTINRTLKSQLIMIWLLEDILQHIPKGFHDWHKFIKPNELMSFIYNIGFRNAIIRGFDLTGGNNFQLLKNLIVQGLSRQQQNKKTELWNVKINEDTSVWYIGLSIKFCEQN